MVTIHERGAMKSAAPVGKSVEKAPEMYPSVLNSMMGLVPVGGRGTVVGDEKNSPVFDLERTDGLFPAQ